LVNAALRAPDGESSWGFAGRRYDDASLRTPRDDRHVQRVQRAGRQDPRSGPTATVHFEEAGLAPTAALRASAQRRLRWELLAQLVRKDLKVKYQGSALGFAWSLANPLLLLAVYSFVFQVVFKSGIPSFGIYLMSGLLIWNAFQLSVMGAAGSVTGNAGLVRKVPFPLTVLPLSSVGFAGVHYVLQLAVLVVVMLATGFSFLGPQLLLLLPAIAVAIVFAVALGLIVGSLNVRYRDTEHLVEVAMLAWFWVNPIVYGAGIIRDRLHGWFWVYMLNPMAPVVGASQRALYRNPYYTDPSTGKQRLLLEDPRIVFYLEWLGIALAVSLVLFYLGRRLFDRLSGDFAEEL
jgi:ABC-2 type transport system permease protein